MKPVTSHSCKGVKLFLLLSLEVLLTSTWCSEQLRRYPNRGCRKKIEQQMIHRHPERKGEVSTKWTKFVNDVPLNTITDIEFKAKLFKFSCFNVTSACKVIYCVEFLFIRWSYDLIFCPMFATRYIFEMSRGRGTPLIFLKLLSVVFFKLIRENFFAVFSVF